MLDVNKIERLVWKNKRIQVKITTLHTGVQSGLFFRNLIRSKA